MCVYYTIVIAAIAHNTARYWCEACSVLLIQHYKTGPCCCFLLSVVRHRYCTGADDACVMYVRCGVSTLVPAFKYKSTMLIRALVISISASIRQTSPPLSMGGLRTTQDLRRRTEITPVKDSHNWIKPLALTNGHSRYITAIIHPNGNLCPLKNGRCI